MNDLKGIIEDCNKSDLVSKKVIKKVIEIIGQEEWNDLHDEHSDICTTMGELVITLEGIPDLEKENAELKEKLEIEQNARGDWFGKAVTKDRQITEAKDLIRNLLRVTYGEGWNYSLQVKVEAEQFLKEIE